MVSTVDLEGRRRSTRSRTPSRAIPPQVSRSVQKSTTKKATKSKPAKKAAATTRGRSKTPTRQIVASTPKPKSKATPAKKSAASSEKPKSHKKRKSIVLKSDDESDDEVDSRAHKKTKSPKTSANATPSSSNRSVGRPRKNSDDGARVTRHSRRLQELNSISVDSKSSRDLSNGGLNQSGDASLNESQSASKWGWFSCNVM